MTDLRAVDLGEDVKQGLAGISEEAEETGAPKKRPRARRKPAAEVLPKPAPQVLGPLEGPPPGVTHWGAKKRNSHGEWEVQLCAAEGTQIALREWPLSELSEDLLFQRWGAGDFQIFWVKPTATGGRHYMPHPREVRVLPPTAPTAPAAEVASSIFAGPVGEAFNLMQMFEKMQDAKESRDMAKTASMLQMMQALGGQQSRGGLGAAELELILRNQQETTMAAVRAAVAPIQAEIATLRAAQAEDDGEGVGSGVAAAAGAAGALFKGRGVLPQVLRFAADQPELTGKALDVIPVALPVVTSALGSLADVLRSFLKKPEAPRPVAMVRQIEPSTPVHAASAGPVEVSDGSLSSWAPPSHVNGAAVQVVPQAAPEATIGA